jgi:hypothetical protein
MEWVQRCFTGWLGLAGCACAGCAVVGGQFGKPSIPELLQVSDRFGLLLSDQVSITVFYLSESWSSRCPCPIPPLPNAGSPVSHPIPQCLSRAQTHCPPLRLCAPPTWVPRPEGISGGASRGDHIQSVSLGDVCQIMVARTRREGARQYAGWLTRG